MSTNRLGFFGAASMITSLIRCTRQKILPPSTHTLKRSDRNRMIRRRGKTASMVLNVDQALLAQIVATNSAPYASRSFRLLNVAIGDVLTVRSGSGRRRQRVPLQIAGKVADESFARLPASNVGRKSRHLPVRFAATSPTVGRVMRTMRADVALV